MISAQAFRPQIGVFDSGFGGLTVLRELSRLIPNADYLYLGDTARLPYGSKSAATVSHFAISSAQFLEQHGATQLVVACNTASALALEAVRKAIRIPVIGVIEPGANSATAATTSRVVSVIGTAATISSHAYKKALEQRGVYAIEKACPLFVPLVEEGWTDHPVTEQVARIYLAELAALGGDGNKADVLVLGCTHYPLLRPLLRRILAPEVQIIDSAEATACLVESQLAVTASSRAAAPSLRFFATDSVEKFRSLGANFLGRAIEHVELVSFGD